MSEAAVYLGQTADDIGLSASEPVHYLNISVDSHGEGHYERYKTTDDIVLRLRQQAKGTINAMNNAKAINSALAFFLELAMLASFSYWGFHGNKSVWLKWGLGVGIPLGVAILWGFLLAPRASRRLGSVGGNILSLALFCLAAAALYQAGQPVPAIIFAVVAVINRILLWLWKQW